MRGKCVSIYCDCVVAVDDAVLLVVRRWHQLKFFDLFIDAAFEAFTGISLWGSIEYGIVDGVAIPPNGWAK